MRAKPAPCSMNRTNTRAGRLARPRRINARRVSFLQRLNLNPEEVIEIDLEADELQAPKLSCRRTSCCSGSTRRCTCWQLFIPNQLYWGWSSPSVPSILLPQDEPPHSSYPGGYQKIWDRGCVKNPQVKRMIPQRHSPPSRDHRSRLCQYPPPQPTESQRPAHRELSRGCRLAHTTLQPVLMRDWKRSDLTRTAIYPGVQLMNQPGNSSCPLRPRGRDRWLPILRSLLHYSWDTRLWESTVDSYMWSH